MKLRVAGIVIGLLVAGVPAFAQDLTPERAANAAVPKPATGKEHKARAKKAQIAATSAPAQPGDDQTGTVTRRKGKAAAKGVRTAAVPAAYAALPETERLGIQSDLAWLGDYDATANGNADELTVAAIKAYQKRHNAKETGVLTDEQRAALAAAVKGPEDAVGWRWIDDPATGARLGVPDALVAQGNAGRIGSRWSSAHGQIQIETFRLHEAALPALFDDERRTPRTRQIEYSVLNSDSFIISGMQGLKKLLVHVQSSGGELRGVTILYDQATEGTMAPVAVAISNTFQGFPDPNAPPPPGRRRGVEYGTAIVASSHGDLITTAQLTDECASLTVPGLGHAERIAADKTDDLALIRLYGARNLSPAALAGDSAKADDLTLVGVADPLVQGGGDAVASASAHLTGQILDPAPKLGFSGAAAVDAQNRFAGVVELKSPVVAGPGSVGQQAALVPADAVRGFLAAQGITAATAPKPMDQSVLRVICVRK